MIQAAFSMRKNSVKFRCLIVLRIGNGTSVVQADKIIIFTRNNVFSGS